MLSEHDDGLMQKYLDGVEVPAAELRSAVRRATLALEVVPVLYGASFRNKGVHPLLDAIVDYLPSPADVRPVVGHHPRTQAEETRPASDEAPFSGLVFKIANDPFLGSLAYFRVYSGKAKIGQAVYNSTKGEEEKLSRLLEMHANKRKEIKEVYAGDIAAMGSMKNISTGRHALPQEPPHRPRVHPLPRAGHRGDDRAQDQGRPRQAGHDPGQARPRGPHPQGQPGPDDGPDPAPGDGGAPPRDRHGPDGARVRRPGQPGQAPGRLQRDHPGRGRGRGQVHPPGRRQGPLRPLRPPPRAPRPGPRLRVRRPDPGRRSSPGSSSATSRTASARPSRPASWPATR